MNDPAIEGYERAFETLGLSPDASARDVRRAYRRAVRDHPPDRDAAQFERVRSAYELLSSPEGAFGRLRRTAAQLPDVAIRPPAPIDLDRELPLATLRAIVARLDVADLMGRR